MKRRWELRVAGAAAGFLRKDKGDRHTSAPARGRMSPHLPCSLPLRGLGLSLPGQRAGRAPEPEPLLYSPPLNGGTMPAFQAALKVP